MLEGASQVALMVKKPPANVRDWLRDAGSVSGELGRVPRRRAWQPTPVFVPGESPWTEEPGGLQSVGSENIGHDWSNTLCLKVSVSSSPLLTGSFSNGERTFLFISESSSPASTIPVGLHVLGACTCRAWWRSCFILQKRFPLLTLNPRVAQLTSELPGACILACRLWILSNFIGSSSNIHPLEIYWASCRGCEA